MQEGKGRSNNRPMAQQFLSLFTSQAALCSLPILVLVTISSLDAADKQLLASSFPVLERTLGLSVETLGYFSLFTNGSYALSLPLWGYSVHKFGIANVHLLLSIACASWGIATIGIAVFGSSLVGQAIFRAVVGVALGSIMPLSQTLLIELVDVAMRGRAFGLMLFFEKLAATLTTTTVVYLDTWEIPYYVLGLISLTMGYSAWTILSPDRRKLAKKEDDPRDPSLLNSKESMSAAPAVPQLTFKQILQRIIQMPAFMCMVAQGVFGGTPWDMMSFLLLLMDWRGFSKAEIISIQVSSGLSMTFGGWLGGYLGDFASQRWGTQGRILVAFVSVLGGIPLYCLHLYATNYRWAILWINAFGVWGTWTQSGALRPICADLTRNASERAQIISLWIVLEKISGAVFGAPLVGYLTSNMLAEENTMNEPVDEQEAQILTPSEKAHALAFNLMMLSSLFWGVCSIFWVVMSYTIHKSVHFPDFATSPSLALKDGIDSTIRGVGDLEMKPLL